MVNYEDSTQGEIKLSKSTFGEVTINDVGVFIVEQRGMTQALKQQNIIEVYNAECPADLGDSRCTVDLIPSMVKRLTSYTIGDLVRTSSLAEGFIDSVLQVSADISLNDESSNNAVATLGSQAALSTLVKKVGAASVEFTPSGSVDPSNSFVSYPDIDAYSIKLDRFNIECFVRFKDLTSNVQTIASHYLSSGNERAWFIQRNGASLEFVAYSNGSAVGATLTGSISLAIDTWYHIEVNRDLAGDIRLFIDGTQVDIINYTGNIHNSITDIRIGKLRSSGLDDLPLYGFVDQFRFIVGQALHTSNFTPSIVAFSSAVLEENIPLVDFDSRDYICTITGKTNAQQPSYDVTLGNVTVDGTATFMSREAYFQFAVVLSIESNRKFKVTQLTPASAFPEEWFNGGAVIWQTGSNTGKAIEVKIYTKDDGIVIEQDIELFLATSFNIQVGDTLGVYPGCNKLLVTCRDKFSNLDNFRGFPHIPGPGFIPSQIPEAKA